MTLFQRGERLLRRPGAGRRRGGRRVPARARASTCGSGASVTAARREGGEVVLTTSHGELRGRRAAGRGRPPGADRATSAWTPSASSRATYLDVDDTLQVRGRAVALRRRRRQRPRASSPTWASTRPARPARRSWRARRGRRWTPPTGRRSWRPPTTYATPVGRVHRSRRWPASGAPPRRRSRRAFRTGCVEYALGNVAGSSLFADGYDGHGDRRRRHRARGAARRRPSSGRASPRCCRRRRSPSSARCRSAGCGTPSRPSRR